ncbi:MAG: sporulation initiation factor Spo0A C-terminal domain-containing protein [Lachnospiraceae bacterium]|nr:sporulation initiation factor Spo0A C-terminal domain-containing protein [Lachnospiraceae bacterium]
MNTGMSSRDLERYITQVMLDMGIPAHLKGYHYLREAILISEQDMNTLTSVTKLLYPSIAKRYHTTETKVERAIRNAIEVSWKRGNMQAFRQMFGYSFLTGQHRPTNSEYIYQLADKIRTDLSESS